MSIFDSQENKVGFIREEQPVSQSQTFKEIHAGSGAKSFNVTDDGVWIGAEVYANAPFKIAYDGKFVFGSKTDSKYIEWDGSALTIRGALNADDISAGTIIGRTLKANNGTGVDVWVSNDGKIYFKYNTSTKAFLQADSGGSFILNSDGTFHVQGQEYVQINYNYGGGSGEFLVYNDNNLVFKLNDAMDAWFKQEVSAASFDDRTPYFDGDALAELKKIKGKTKKVNNEDKLEIDHESMPEFMQSYYKDENGNRVMGRNLSNTVSMLVRAVVQLTERIDELEKKHNQ